ncbi:hypothetical protein P153DRAFT_344245 [Dothidotthia symphoricarpi CBS 119687]|uniref:AIG1-type G domain-containing protein n=1 Tax=Dothidotthia symphoricarpi CBS 119687 TaxID=1392245 RepID=A0A6A6A8F5_9PLEO|nr:uncharacterized protein P153DRAFT_344245 [Dothidotthia symphoricarpi CBS 119687]KAF2127836.1 hypothetical protein P153DRAFT_344245 [Dothidotthia symphoricarpi CBS 119687]
MMVSNEDANRGMILIMGCTGSGKSYFINKLADSSVVEGHGLRSETKTCDVVRVGVGRHEIAVVDTPGFDDTSRSDAEILEGIVEFLCAQYELGIPLKGIIYMHRITDVRMSGSAQRYFDIFRRVCGEQNLSNVVLLTTMWSELKDEGKGLQRERELRRDFWNDMESRGSTIRRFDGSRSMAEAFVCRLMRKQDIVLDIQEELVDQGKRLGDTKAGQLVLPQLERQIGDFGQTIHSLDQMIDDAKRYDPIEVKRLEKQRAMLLKEHHKSMNQHQRLQQRTGRIMVEKIEGEKKRNKMKGRLAMFTTLLGLAITATVNIILPLAGVISF